MKPQIAILTSISVIILFLFSSYSCHSKKQVGCEYPELIKQYSLENLYDKAVIDWYIINTTDWLFSGDYLVVYDQVADSVLRHCDTISGYMTLNRNLVSSYDTMKNVLPNHVYRYEQVRLVIPDFIEEFNYSEDTILFTLFPELDNNEYILDLTGGYAYNLYYYKDQLVRIGANDYFEIDIDANSFPRDSLWNNCKKKFNEGGEEFSEWWKCQFMKMNN